MDGAAFMAIAAIFAGFFLVLSAVGIVCYIFLAIGLYKICKDAGDQYAWMAWVPFLQIHCIGYVVGEYQFFKQTIPNLQWTIFFIYLTSIVSAIPVIGWLVGLAVSVAFFFILHKFYYILNPQKATMYLVLSIILPFTMPFFIFAERNTALGSAEDYNYVI